MKPLSLIQVKIFLVLFFTNINQAMVHPGICKLIQHQYLSNKQQTAMFAFSQKHSFSSNALRQGPATGAVAYWTTKTLFYGTATVATITTIVSAGGLDEAAGIANIPSTPTLKGSPLRVGTINQGTAEGTDLIEQAALILGGFFTLCPFLP